MSGSKQAALIAVLMLLATSEASAQLPVAVDAEWPSYNRDLAGTRYSPLGQIYASNVSELRQVWSYALGRNETTGDLGGGFQFTPLVVGGVMYMAAADRIVVLDPETGEELW